MTALRVTTLTKESLWKIYEDAEASFGFWKMELSESVIDRMKEAMQAKVPEGWTVLITQRRTIDCPAVGVMEIHAVCGDTRLTLKILT